MSRGAAVQGVKYAFCEGAWVTGAGRWHIRKLSPAGLKLSGGIDTPSLCGRVEGLPKHNGWDFNVQISNHHLAHACVACTEAYYAEMEKEKEALAREKFKGKIEDKK